MSYQVLAVNFVLERTDQQEHNPKILLGYFNTKEEARDATPGLYLKYLEEEFTCILDCERNTAEKIIRGEDVSSNWCGDEFFMYKVGGDDLRARVERTSVIKYEVCAIDLENSDDLMDAIDSLGVFDTEEEAKNATPLLYGYHLIDCYHDGDIDDMSFNERAVFDKINNGEDVSASWRYGRFHFTSSKDEMCYDKYAIVKRVNVAPYGTV